MLEFGVVWSLPPIESMRQPDSSVRDSGLSHGENVYPYYELAFTL